MYIAYTSGHDTLRDVYVTGFFAGWGSEGQPTWHRDRAEAVPVTRMEAVALIRDEGCRIEEVDDGPWRWGWRGNAGRRVIRKQLPE